MRIDELVALAEAQSDEMYTASEWVDLINLCLDDLSPIAKKLVLVTGQTVTVSATRGTIKRFVGTASLGYWPNGTVAIVTDNTVAPGTDYSVEVVLAAEINAAMSVAFDSGVLTITLGTDGDGAADVPKNTATLIAAAINNTVGTYFTATASGDGSASISTVSAAQAFTAPLADAQEIITVFYTPAAGAKTRLRKLSFQDNYSKGWKMDTTNIYLQGLGTEVTGTAEVLIYDKLPHVSYDSDTEVYTPEILPEPLSDQYHGVVVSFLCAKSQQREEELEDKQDFWGDYLSGKQGFMLDRLKEMEPGRYRQAVSQAVAST